MDAGRCLLADSYGQQPTARRPPAGVPPRASDSLASGGRKEQRLQPAVGGGGGFSKRLENHGNRQTERRLVENHGNLANGPEYSVYFGPLYILLFIHFYSKLYYIYK